METLRGRRPLVRCRHLSYGARLLSVALLRYGSFICRRAEPEPTAYRDDVVSIATPARGPVLAPTNSWLVLDRL